MPTRVRRRIASSRQAEEERRRRRRRQPRDTRARASSLASQRTTGQRIRHANRGWPRPKRGATRAAAQPPSCYPPAAYPHYQQMAAGYWEAEPPPPPFADRVARAAGARAAFSPLKDTDGPSATPLSTDRLRPCAPLPAASAAHTAACRVRWRRQRGAAAAAAEWGMRSALPPPGRRPPSGDGHLGAKLRCAMGSAAWEHVHGPPGGIPPPYMMPPLDAAGRSHVAAPAGRSRRRAASAGCSRGESRSSQLHGSTRGGRKGFAAQHGVA